MKPCSLDLAILKQPREIVSEEVCFEFNVVQINDVRNSLVYTVNPVIGVTLTTKERKEGITHIANEIKFINDDNIEKEKKAMLQFSEISYLRCSHLKTKLLVSKDNNFHMKDSIIYAASDASIADKVIDYIDAVNMSRKLTKTLSEQEVSEGGAEHNQIGEKLEEKGLEI